MLKCPNCQSSLKSDFGYETCSKCGSVVFIDLDGSVVLQEEHHESLDFETDEEEAIVSGDAALPDMSSDIQITEDIGGNFDLAEEEIVSDDEDEIYEDEESHIGGYEVFESHVTSEANGAFFDKETSDEDSEDVSFEDDSENVFEDNTEDDGTGQEYVVTTADDFLEEMQMFGEIDSDKFKESIYFFDIEIAGIDSKDIRDEILESLNDERLALIGTDFNRQISNGILILKAISAVKAHVIIQRISHLPCEISWTLVEVQDLMPDAENFEDSNADLLSDENDYEESSDIDDFTS